MKLKSPPGFSLIEVLLSVAALGVILGISIPAYNTLQVRNDLEIATFALVQNFHRAQILSQSSSGDTSWGVYIATSSILIYKGNSYSSRDSSFDEIISISPSIVVTGLSEINFSKMYGMPNNTGTTTLTSVINEKRNIYINQKGTISY